MILRFLALFFIIQTVNGYAQIVVSNNPPMNTEEYIVNNVLLGDDLNTSNYTSVGFANGIGYFDGFNSNIGFDEGVVLSTGGIEFVSNGFGAGSGVSGDSDLELALNAINLNWNVNNVTVLEFDFVAESESVAFNYVFGSSEYTSYTCTQYNDIFGFFLSGPGIEGPYSNNGINLAYIPDPNNPGQYTTTPVAVNTVNSGSPTGGGNAQTCADIDPNWQDYSVYWIDNSAQTTVFGINGFTTPFVAEYNGLVCGETYHIKLAIADASDSALNSAVFIEANSFVSPSVVVNPISNIDGPDLFNDPLAIYEGCAAAQLEFTATQNTEYDIVLEVLFDGDVDYGTDFVISYNDGNTLEECINNEGEISQCVTIPAGQNTLYLNIQAFYDDDEENLENLNVTINAIDGLCQQADLAVSEIFFNLYDQIEITVDPGDPPVIECFGDQVFLQPANVSGGYIGDSGNYSYEWFDINGDFISSEVSLQVNSENASNYQLVVSDDCQDQQVETSFSVEVIDYLDIEMNHPDLVACYSDIISVNPVVTGGSGNFSYVWPDDPNPCNCESYDFVFESQNGENQSVEFQIIDECTSLVYDFSIPIQLQELLAPSGSFNVVGSQFCPGDELTLSLDIDGESTYSYDWVNLNSSESFIENTASISPQENFEYDVAVIDECNNNETLFSYNLETPVYPPPSFDLSDFTGCVGQEIEISVENLFAQGVTDPNDLSQYSFFWSTGETSPTINVIVLENETSYSVEISDLCGNVSAPQQTLISASTPPPPQFTFEYTADGHQFYTSPSEIFSDFNWDFGDGNFSDEIEPLHFFEQEGDYYVTLTASDDLGCQNSSIQIINIFSNLLFYSPNVFSPNGDGVNDVFNISVVGQDDFELMIFDRWGNQLFTTTDPYEGWDGTYQNGQEVPQDVYMYKVFMSNPSVGEKVEQGKVSIIK